MKWQEINKTIKVLITSGSLVGAFGVIWMITFLTGSEVSYTNWENCTNGTDCYARFEVEESYYRICFNIDETVTEPHYFKKVARSRTIWINTSLYGFVSTDPNIPTKLMVGTYKSKGIEQAPDGKWLRDIKTRDCIERTKTNYLYVKGEKQSNQEVEWKADIFGIDPTWKGELVKEEKIKTKSMIFRPVIEVELLVDLDTKYPIEILSYNETHLTFNVMTNYLEVEKMIPLKVNDEVKHKLKFEKVTDVKSITILFGLNDTLKWGDNSTTVRYNITSNSGYVLDDYTTGCSGTGHSLSQGISVRVGVGSSQEGYETRGFMEFDTSAIPDTATINSAMLYAYLSSNVFEGGENEDANVYSCDYGALTTADFQGSVGTNHGIIVDDTSATTTWYNRTIGIGNISKTGVTQFCLRHSAVCRDEFDLWVFSCSNASPELKPYLNVTYTEALAEDSCSNCDGTKDCYWDCSDECNITSNINMGGYNININQSTTGNHAITITGNITNIGNITTSGYDSSNKCTILCESQGGFK